MMFATQDSVEDTEEFSYISSVNGTLFVVDCSNEMVERDPATGVSQLQLSLEAIKNTYCNKLIGGSKDHLGVLLYATDSTTNGYEGLHVLLPLDQPDKECVETLDSSITSCKEGGVKCGHSQDYSVYHLLWTCSNIYTCGTKKLGSRQVMILTNVSEPPNLDSKTRTLAVTKSRDMSELGILISLVALSSHNTEFCMEKFYSALVPDQDAVKPAGDLEELSARVHRRETKPRMSGELPFVVGPGLTVGVQLYNMFGDATTGYQNLCSKTSQPVVTCSTVVKETDRSILLQHEQYRSRKFGSDTIIFSPEEVTKMKLSTDKGVYLIGFKSSEEAVKLHHVSEEALKLHHVSEEAVKLHHVSGKSMFVRPSEAVFMGSSNFFQALLERCLARKVVPLCHCVPRAGSVGYIAVLLPQGELRDEDNEQIKPAGFHMIKLPYAEDIRKLDYEPTLSPNKVELEAGKTLVQRLKAKYNSCLIENPQDQQFQKTLEAIALERDSVEEIQDLTLPDTTSLDKRAGTQAANFGGLFFGTNYSVPKDCRIPNYKQVIGEVQQKHIEGTLSKLTVADLRLYCKGTRLQVSSTAKKAELLEAIKKFLG